MASTKLAKRWRAPGAVWVAGTWLLAACPQAGVADAGRLTDAGSAADAAVAGDGSAGADRACLSGGGPGPCDAAGRDQNNLADGPIDTGAAIDAGRSDAAPTPDAVADAAAAADGNADDAGAAVLHLLTAEQLNGMLASKDFLLIDVRGGTPASQIPQTDATIVYTDTDALTTRIGSDLDARVVLYCNSGNRSGIAGRALVGLGYRAIYSLSGGISGWIAAGYPTIAPGADGG